VRRRVVSLHGCSSIRRCRQLRHIQTRVTSPGVTSKRFDARPIHKVGSSFGLRQATSASFRCRLRRVREPRGGHAVQQFLLFRHESSARSAHSSKQAHQCVTRPGTQRVVRCGVAQRIAPAATREFRRYRCRPGSQNWIAHFVAYGTEVVSRTSRCISASPAAVRRLIAACDGHIVDLDDARQHLARHQAKLANRDLRLSRQQHESARPVVNAAR
jgi:hypothetical protein